MNSLLERPNLVSILILFVVLLLAGGYGVITYTQRPETNTFNVDENYDFNYDFSRASRIVDLPKDLEEISGLALWKAPNEVIAIQDEDGEAFVVNTNTGNIETSFKFSKDRDYEGIARNADTLYVLETDGDIHTFVLGPAGTETEYESDKLETEFSYRNDTEGICYDPVTGHLLIAPKEQALDPAAGDESRRGIYAFDLKTRRLNPQPSYYIDEYEIGEIVYGKQSRYTVKPSGLAVDPLTNDLYILASVGSMLIVIDRESNLKHLELLDDDIFKQPEGICFSDSGDLYISSEGRGGKGIIATIARRALKDQKPATDE